MKFYFQIQFRRFSRKLKDLGVPPILGFSVLSIGFYSVSSYIFEQFERAEYYYLVLGFILTPKLSYKLRNDFLRSAFPQRNYRIIRLAENLLLFIPFAGFLLFKGYYALAFCGFGVVATLSQINKFGTFDYVLPTPFGKRPFEFAQGFRKNFLGIVFAYFIAFMATKSGNPNLGVLSLLILALVVMGFYSKPEKTYFVWVFDLTPRHFLKQKLLTAALYFSCLCFPIVLLVSIFFSWKAIDIVLISFLFGLLLVTACILGKYDSFPSSMPLNQSILVALSALLPPVVLIAIPYFYFRAVKRLKPILG